MVTKTKPNIRAHLYIDEWMEELLLNDEKVGEIMGKSRTTVWRWRTEQHRLNPEKIAAMAVAMGLEPEDLWRPPGRPSIDAIVKDETEDGVRRIANAVRALLKAG